VNKLGPDQRPTFKKTSEDTMNKQLFSVAMLAVIIGGAVAFYLQQQDPLTASAPESATTRPSATPQGTAMADVKPASLTGNEILGKTAFDAKCATCHGENAAGQNGVAPPLIHKIYEPGHHGDQAFFLAAQNGARAHHWPFGDMPPVKGLTRADITNIVAYVRAMQRANGIF
jgi:mono/diheme cytochrome c family protein